MPDGEQWTVPVVQVIEVVEHAMKGVGVVPDEYKVATSVSDMA